MFEILKFKGKTISPGELKDLDAIASTVWVDCLNPTKQDLEEISKHTCVILEDIKEALDPEERPRISEYKDYTVIAFKTPLRKGKEVLTITMGIILLKHGIITLRTKNIKAIKQLKNLTEIQKSNIFNQGPGLILYWLFNYIIDDFFDVMESIEEKLDSIENQIFKGVQDSIMKEIFKLKKTLIYFHKGLIANREVINQMDKEFVKELKPQQVKRFKTLYNDTNELIDIESTYKDILTSQIEIYLTSVSNQMNAVMKRLTAMASFVLIPTLITGIYGMNFKYIPEISMKYGYPMSLGIMIGSVILLYIYFKKKKYL